MAETTVTKSGPEDRGARGGHGFSSFTDAAAEHGLGLMRAREIVEEHEQRCGQLTDDELAAARRACRGE